MITKKEWLALSPEKQIDYIYELGVNSCRGLRSAKEKLLRLETDLNFYVKKIPENDNTKKDGNT